MRPLLFAVVAVLLLAVSLSAQTTVIFLPDQNTDHEALFSTHPDQWRDARARTQVVYFYLSGLLTAGPTSLASNISYGSFAYLAGKGITLGLEAVPMYGTDCNPVTRASDVTTTTATIVSSGGTVATLTMDEPRYYGPGNCGFTESATGDKVVTFASTIHGTYAGIAIGEVEPYPALSIATLEAWINVEIGKGFTPDHFDLDVDITQAIAYQDIIDLRDFCDTKGIPFGVLINSTYTDATDQSYYDHVFTFLDNVMVALRDNGDMAYPDRMKFQSFQSGNSYNRPVVLPETTNYTHTDLLNDAIIAYGPTPGGAPSVNVSTPGQAALSWSAGSGMGTLHYTPMYCAADGNNTLTGNWTTLSSGTSTSATISLPAGHYAFRLQATDDTGLRTFSGSTVATVTAVATVTISGTFTFTGTIHVQ